jgi:hypothetical protein
LGLKIIANHSKVAGGLAYVCMRRAVGVVSGKFGMTCSIIYSNAREEGTTPKREAICSRKITNTFV